MHQKSYRSLAFLTILPSLILGFLPLSHAAEKLPIQEVWAHKEYSDPNDRHLRYLRLDPETFELLFSKIDSSSATSRLWRADINNDGQLEYVFVQTPHQNKDARRLDRVGPIFTQVNGKLTEAKAPPFPSDYTNILSPFLEYGRQGLQMNLHYNVSIDSQGKATSIGNEAKPGADSFVLSRRMSFVWKGSTLKKVKERLLCNEATCTRKQREAIKLSELPRIE